MEDMRKHPLLNPIWLYMVLPVTWLKRYGNILRFLFIFQYLINGLKSPHRVHGNDAGCRLGRGDNHLECTLVVGLRNRILTAFHDPGVSHPLSTAELHQDVSFSRDSTASISPPSPHPWTIRSEAFIVFLLNHSLRVEILRRQVPALMS